ncbi:MAG: hypothetical protein IT299_04445 [Dehalococcoidia bacterium]|nr:hypothetical protein [Dehalococcoidia bacterium]
MSGLARLAAAGAAAAIVAGAVYVLLPFVAPDPLDGCAIGGQLRDAGFSDDFAQIICSSSTEVSAEGDLIRIAHRVPALSLREDTLVGVHPQQAVSAIDGPRLDLGSGLTGYAIHHSVQPLQGGYDRYEAIFIPYEGNPPAVIEELTGRRQSSRAGGAIPIAFTHAAAETGGVIVSSVTTTSDAAGTADTSPNLNSGGDDLGKTAPRLDDPKLDEVRREFANNPQKAELRTAMTPEESEALRRYLESPAGQDLTRRQEAFTRELESRRAAYELGRYGETTEQAVERVMAERSRQSSNRATGRVNVALSGLQAIAEWMQQGLDYFENDAALQAAEDCHNNPTNPVAQNAQRNDPENYNRAREQIREARSENNWDTGVRGLDTARGLGTAAIPGTAGLAAGVMSTGAQGTLRQLQQQRTQQAVSGVTPCDEQATGGGSSASNRGQGSTTPPTPTQPTPPPGTPTAEATSRSPGPSVIITVTATATATPRARNSATVRVEYLHRFEGSDHHITYVATADLSNLLPIRDATGRTIAEYPDVSFRGEGVGAYDEQGTATDGSGARCGVARDGFVPMKLEVWVESRTVNVHIAGPVRRGEIGDVTYCPHNVSDGTNASVSCTFENVDFPPAGAFPYRATVGEASSGPGFVNQELCTLELAPLFWHDGRIVTRPREPEGFGVAAPTQVPIPAQTPGP